MFCSKSLMKAKFLKNDLLHALYSQQQPSPPSYTSFKKNYVIVQPQPQLNPVNEIQTLF